MDAASFRALSSTRLVARGSSVSSRSFGIVGMSVGALWLEAMTVCVLKAHPIWYRFCVCVSGRRTAALDVIPEAAGKLSSLLAQVQLS